jgi:gluconokinase
MASPIVVMGVSGSGKSTVGAALAQRLRVPFADADDFHPPANIKMTVGHLMTTTISVARSDREWLAQHCGDGGVMSCPALRRNATSCADTAGRRVPHLPHT